MATQLYWGPEFGAQSLVQAMMLFIISLLTVEEHLGSQVMIFPAGQQPASAARLPAQGEGLAEGIITASLRQEPSLTSHHLTTPLASQI